jgi:CRP/FNR family transcriptional regulator, anaerobic regulatory protein
MLAIPVPTIRERLRRGESVLTDAMTKNLRLFAAKSVIIEEGNQLTHVIRVISGRAARRRMLADGRSQLISILLHGDIFGVRPLFGGTPTDTIEAITDLAVQSIVHSEIQRLADIDANVALWLIRYASQEHQKVENWLRVLANGTAIEKISFALIDLWRRIRGADNDPVRLPLSQRELAEHVGLTLPHVCRTIAALRDAGVVKIHYGSIEILEPKLLLESAKGVLGLSEGDAGNIPQHFAGQI